MLNASSCTPTTTAANLKTVLRSMSTGSILDSIEKGLDALKRAEEVVDIVQDVYEGDTSLDKAIPELADEWENILNDVKDIKDDLRDEFDWTNGPPEF